jgi:hypothetical protein
MIERVGQRRLDEVFERPGERAFNAGESYGPVVWKNGRVVPKASPSSSKLLYAWDIGVANGTAYTCGGTLWSGDTKLIVKL